MKLIGIDLDGTLLTDEKTISKRSIDVITKLKNENHLVVLTTGRSYAGTINYYKQLNLNTPIITLNGALINFPDGKVIKHTLPQNEIFKFFSELKSIINVALFNSINKIYTYNHNKDLEFIFNGANIINVVEFDVNNISKDILNVVILIDDQNREKFESFFVNTKIKTRYWNTYNNQAFYDLYLEGVSKASALKEVLKVYNLTPNDLITFGDSENDIEMIKLAKYGVAMLNGRDSVKSVCSHITEKDNNNDGVAIFLEKIPLKKSN